MSDHEGGERPPEEPADEPQPPALPDESTPPVPTESTPPWPADIAPLPPTRRRSTARTTALATIVAIALAAAATVVVLRADRDEEPIERLVPANVIAFFKISLDPSTDQRRALRRVLDRFPPAGRDRLGSQIEGFVDDALGGFGLRYSPDVEPWLGGQVGVAAFSPAVGDSVLEPRPVGVLTASDPGGARSALTRARAGASAPFAFEISGTSILIAQDDETLSSFRGAATGGSLDGNPEFARRRAAVGDALAEAWVDGEQLSHAIPLLPGAGIPGLPPTLGGGFRSRSFAGLRATAEGLELVGFQSLPEGLKTGVGKPSILEQQPAGIIGALTLFDPAVTVQQALESFALFFGVSEGIMLDSEGNRTEERSEPPNPTREAARFLRRTFDLDLEDDLYPWLHGEVSVIVGGISTDPTSPFDAGIVIESTDDRAARRTLSALRENLPALGREGGFAVEPADDGFDLEFEQGFRLVVRQAEQRVVAATSQATADRFLTAAADRLADDAVYRRVVGPPSDGVGFQLFVRLDRIRQLVEPFLPSEIREEYEREVAPYLRPLEALGMRSTVSGTEAEFRLVLTVADGS